jgi:hypothetical protein
MGGRVEGRDKDLAGLLSHYGGAKEGYGKNLITETELRRMSADPEEEDDDYDEVADMEERVQEKVQYLQMIGCGRAKKLIDLSKLSKGTVCVIRCQPRPP